MDLIFRSDKIWSFTFSNEKFFTPLSKVFYPHFSKHKIRSWKLRVSSILPKQLPKRGGKKLLGGVKNFFHESSTLQDFPEQKINVISSKLNSNSGFEYWPKLQIPSVFRGPGPAPPGPWPRFYFLAPVLFFGPGPAGAMASVYESSIFVSFLKKRR